MINNEKLILITPPMLVLANKKMLSGEMWKSMNINLRDQLNTYEELIDILEEKSKVDNLKYSALEGSIKLIEENHEAAINNEHKKKRKAFMLGTAIGAVAVLIVGLII